MTIRPHTALVIDTNSIQRATYLVLGFGIIATALVYPPVTTTWLAVANLMGIIFVLMGMVGKRILPVLDGTSIPVDSRLMTNTLSLLIGLSVVVLAIALPPVSTAWFAFAHFAGIVLVTKSILGYGFLMDSETQASVEESYSPANAASNSTTEHLNIAA